MSDSLRTGDPHPVEITSDADRNTKIEELLVTGLDHYFAARYEQAVNVWTRVLFLDRGHSRARAYIDRARSALAERQRESEELLQRGISAFHRGDDTEAKRLLRAALDGGAGADEAHTFLARLNLKTDAPIGEAGRPDAPIASLQAPSSGRQRAVSLVADVPSRSRFVPIAAGVLILLVIVGGYMIAVQGGDAGLLFSLRRPTVGVGVVSVTRETVLPVPERGELSLSRARDLAAGGRLHEALALLETIRPTDPQKSEADRVRADLQHQLLGLTPQPPARPTSEPQDRR